MRKNLILFGFFLFFLLPFLSLYPNPTHLTVTIYRVFYPPIDPYLEEIGYIAEKFNGMSPREIEKYIKLVIPYRYDWETYNLPWYFPTVEEAVAKREGDCKTRMVIFSSVLEYHELPYTILSSPTHIWVEYEGKEPTDSERFEVAMISSGPGETPSMSTPQTIRWRDSSDSFRRGFWEYMPLERKSLFLFSLGFSSLFVFFPTYTEKYFYFKRGAG